MRILVVDTLAERGHTKFNSFFLEQLGSMAEIDVASFGNLASPGASHTHIQFPEHLLVHNSKLHFRWNQIQILRQVLRIVETRTFDFVVFLSYENISFSLVWPSRVNTLIFTHNNLDRIDNFWPERLLYRMVPDATLHLVFERGMAAFLQAQGKRAWVIPHPMVELDASAGCPAPIQPGLIFAPSGGNRPEVIASWVQDAQRQDSYFLIAKGLDPREGPGFDIRNYFEDYASIFDRAEYILLPLDFKYRASSVFHEAMTSRKKIIATPSLAMNELALEFPHCIFLLDTMDQLEHRVIDPLATACEHDRYRLGHSPDAIGSQLLAAFKQFNPISNG